MESERRPAWEPSIFDLDCPDWGVVNEHGAWCAFCGNLIIPVFHFDEDSSFPEECGTCGAPDDHEKMTEYFT